MLERYLTAASTYAHSIDHLFILIAAIVGFWLIVAESMMFWPDLQVSRQGRASNAVHHRGRKASEAVDFHPSLPGHRLRHRHYRRRNHGLVQHQASHAACRRRPCASSASNGPGASSSRALTAFWIRPMTFARWANCTSMVNTTYHFELMSRDVVHSFAVPAFRLKQDALPGRTITGWFRPNRVGTYDIQCTQMCGMGHALDGGANHCRDAAGPRRLADAQFESRPWLSSRRLPASAPRCGAMTMAEVRR